jgi:Carboxypeptidase regulatory-like domain
MKTYLLRLALLLPAFLFASLLNAQADGSGTIKATVLDIDKRPLPGAVVRIVGTNIGGATDMDGVVNLRAVSAGTYEVEARMVGYKAYVKRNVVVSAGQTAYLSYPMQLKTCDTCDIIVYGDYAKSPVDKEYSTITNITAQQIKVMAVSRGDVTGMITNTCSSCSQTPSGGLVMRGSRPGQSQMFVDGEKIYGSSSVPGLAIGQITVLSGGIPAEYGDLSGGAVIVTTKDYIGGGVDKRNMYTAAAEEQAAREKAEAEKNGKKETNDEIIEEQKADSTQSNQPAPQEAPAPQPEPQNPQAPQTPATPAEQPR